ncbi:MAG TPA: hypothetical protein VLH08_16025, partial [Acidobacteriota bacterium]|nr:hypothetical protein [Acidobacteriota bacterium]
MNTFRQAFLIFVFVFVFGGLCLSEECTVPPAGSLTLAESFDPKWTAMWCSDQPMIDTLWYGLSLDETGDSWDEGWGYEDVCNNNLFLSRLFNAGFIVREVQKISKHFGEPHDGTQYLPNHDWWNFVKAREDDGYEPMCCNGETKLATHYCCATSTDLCIKWAFKRAAAPRSSTLVHEATHEDVGHIDDDDCPKGGSCDTFYGDYNATTMQINYLYDGVSAYLIETVNNQVQRQISQFTSGGKEMCKFISLLENDERNAQLTLAKEKLDNNFAYGAVFPDLGPTWDIVDDKFGTPWECKSCKLAEYTFTPGVDNKACNEVVNSANAAVNDAMQNACTQFNQNIDNSPGAEGYAQIYGEFYSKTTNKCLPYDQAALDQYCEDQQAKAKTVDDLDPYGWLSDYGYNEEFNCAADFCQERFQETWSNHAGDPNWDDPLGCLDLLCGNDPVCRKRFLTYGGDPEYYDPDYCFGELLTCYEKEGVVYEPPGRGG